MIKLYIFIYIIWDPQYYYYYNTFFCFLKIFVTNWRNQIPCVLTYFANKSDSNKSQHKIHLEYDFIAKCALILRNVLEQDNINNKK